MKHYSKKRLKSIERYKLVAQRCQKLIDLSNVLEADNCLKKKWDSDELIRCAIVLKIASMDAFFTDKFIEIFVPFAKKNGISKELETIIKKTGITFGESLDILTQTEPLETLLCKMKNKIEKHVTQEQEKIDFLFKGFGINSISSAAEKYDNLTAIKKDDLLKKVRLLVKRRHSIVHYGDITPTGSVKRIGLGTIKKIENIDRFVTACEYLLNKQLDI